MDTNSFSQYERTRNTHTQILQKKSILLYMKWGDKKNEEC